MKDKKGIISRIKQIFETEATEKEFADAKTEDGRILKADEFIVDAVIVEVTEDGEIPVEDGTYVLESGMSLVVEAGVIAEVIEAEVEETETEDVEEEMETETFSTVIKEISNWEITVDADAIEVGTKLKQIVIDPETGETREEWTLNDGEYELEDGSKVQVDSSGVVVLITAAGSTEEVVEEEEVIEEESDDFSEVLTELQTAIKEFNTMKESFTSLKEENEKLKLKVAKFAGADSEEETETEINFSANTKEEKLKFFGKK